jgi:AcrR family transcriptional regulator
VTTQTRRRGNKEKLLEGALKCLRDKGYANTTARDLVAASGANLNSIGYHFGGKEELLNEAVIAGFEAWTAAVEQTTFAAETDTSPERLERSLAAMIDRFDELRPYLLSFVEAFPPAIRSPRLRGRMADAYREVRAAGADMTLRAVQADGAAMSREHAETLSSLLLAVCDGLMLQWLLDPEPVPSSVQIMEALGAAGSALG